MKLAERRATSAAAAAAAAVAASALVAEAEAESTGHADSARDLSNFSPRLFPINKPL